MSAAGNTLARLPGRGGAASGPRPRGGMAHALRCLLPLAVLAAIVTAGCGGGLSTERPVGEATDVPANRLLELEFPAGQPKEYRLPFSIPGFFRPYESSIGNCPEWVTLYPDQGILAGRAPGGGAGSQHFCTYTVTEADPGFRPRRSVSYGLRLDVVSPSAGALTLPALAKITLTAGTYYGDALPKASGGVQPYTYSFTCAGGQLPPGMGFARETLMFAGTPDARFRDSCTYTVEDGDTPPATVSRAVEVEVTGGASRPLTLPANVVPGNVLRLRVDERVRITFQPATGGVAPYTYTLQCPDPAPGTFPPPTVLPPGLGFGPQTQVLSGTPEVAYRGPDCTYRVEDNDSPPQIVARSVALIIEDARAKWRFVDNDRSLAQQDQPLNRDNDADPQLVHELPVAEVEEGTQPDDTDEVYRLIGVRPPLKFDPDPAAPQLQYVHPTSDRDPAYGSTSTYRYQVLFGNTVDDTLCIDVSYRDEDVDDDDDRLIASVRIRDDAYWNGEDWQCPATALQPASTSRPAPSNPVHTALAPVHARRAVDVAHTAVRDRVRAWSRGDARALTAFAPAIGLASLSGRSGGFDYSGSSEAVSAGAELGAGSWQAGLVASYVRTDLRYRAGASLAGRGYRAGEHGTEIVSLHPFAAWHAASGGHVWASVGAGEGGLRHRDELGFPSWSRSDLRLLGYAAGASVPVAGVLSGELQAEAGIEAFALEIEGGGTISASLPTLRGRDYRAGLAWRAPLPGAPSLSMAYRHLTGDGPEGGALEARGSASVAEFLHPRLSLTGSAEASFGLGGHDADSWGLGAGLRFAPDGLRRGFGLDLDTRFLSLADERTSGATVRGEAGYGLWGGAFFGTVRPYAGVMRHAGGGPVQHTLGIDLRETPDSTARLELTDPVGGRAIVFRLWHRL